MSSQRYPIGIQTFEKIIEGGYSYIDKTSFILPLINHGQYIFLSRPRRFGKSLLVSTLEAFFEGRRELFKRLAIDNEDIDWTPSPVLHFDFNAENYTLENGLEQLLSAQLRGYERIYGSDEESETLSQRFRSLIEAAYRMTGRQVVVLVDEYDKPLLAIEENQDLLEKNQTILKSFYGNLKTMDRYIRFAFITGVARFSKVSIFSDLNHLDDISMEDSFADICGWNETELLNVFREGIKSLALKRKQSFEETLNNLRNYYDGYKFATEGSRLYNPFSVLRALKAQSIEPFWFGTGSPSFLVKRVRNRDIFPPDLNHQICDKDDLLAVGLDDSNPVPLMFQTGYLTIDRYDEEMNLFTLRFPNKEVEIGFYRDLLPMYAPATKESYSPFSFLQFKKDLYEGRPEEFMKRLATLFKDLPHEDHCESAYRAITYLLSVLCTTTTLAEHHGYRGRSDIETFTRSYIYLFEFKYNKSVEEAMDQIHLRDYAGRFAMDSRTIYLIAANLNEKKEPRGLTYMIEKVGK